MTGSLVAWILAALAALAAVFSFVKLRATRSQLEESESAAASLEQKLRAAQKKAETRSASEQRRGGEAAELRRKLEKAKKRATQARDEQVSDSHRIKELEERLRLRDNLPPAAREVARAPAVSAPSPFAAAPATPATSAVEKPAAPPEPPAVVESEALIEATQRAERAEAECKSVRAKFAEQQTQVKRLRSKAVTQDKLYASMRLELEAKKDRLVTQQEELERLRALRVALMESPGEEVQPLPAEEPALESVASE